MVQRISRFGFLATTAAVAVAAFALGSALPVDSPLHTVQPAHAVSAPATVPLTRTCGCRIWCTSMLRQPVMLPSSMRRLPSLSDVAFLVTGRV